MKFLTELIHKKRAEHDTRHPSLDEARRVDLEPAMPGTPVESLHRASSDPVDFEQFAANERGGSMDAPADHWAEDEADSGEWAEPFAAVAEEEYLDRTEDEDDLETIEEAAAQHDVDEDAEAEELTFAAHEDYFDAGDDHVEDDDREEAVASEAEDGDHGEEDDFSMEFGVDSDEPETVDEVAEEIAEFDGVEPELAEEPEDEPVASEGFDQAAELVETDALTANVEAALSEPAEEAISEDVAEETPELHIWDLDSSDEDDASSDIPDDWDSDVAEVAASIPLKPREVPAQDEAPSRRAGRVRTRLLGFHRPDETEADPFGRPQKKAAASNEPQFPVGWLVIESGPGRGASFALLDGVSKIGRDDDQAVQLDFGDVAISRDNHAVIAYDNELRGFFVGQGGKANLVRINGMPLLSTESLNHGDRIRIGETTLRFVALCGPDFDWSADSELGGLDVAAG